MPRKAKKGRITLYKQPPKLKPLYSDPKPITEIRPTQKTALFQALPPLRLARAQADKEIQDKALPAEVQWLYEHPILWLQALHQMKSDVQRRIEKSRLDVKRAHDFPVSGEPTEEYLKVKRHTAELNIRQVHFLRLVERRIEEVASLLGTDKPVKPATKAIFINTLLTLVQLLDDDDITAARDMALRTAEKLK